MATGQDQDLEGIWRELKSGIQDVYAHRGMTTSRFMQLYSNVYNFCINTTTERAENSQGAGGARSRAGKIRRANIPNADPSSSANPADNSNPKFNTNFIGLNLYHRIQEFLQAYLAALANEGQEKMGEGLLIFYQAQWQNYTFSSKVMNGFCAYLNRHWVRRDCEEGKDHIHQIYQLCLDVWKDTFFESLNRNTTSTLLDCIERHRNGDKVNERLLRDIIGSYVDLGDDGQTVNRPILRLGIYQRKFEQAFLEQTETYYVKEAAEYIHSHELSDYLKKAEQRLAEEEQRIDSYLHPSTLPGLKRVCETILVEYQLEPIHSEFPSLLKGEKQVDLARLYNLVARLDNNAFGNMKEILEQHIAVEGANAIRQNGELCLTDPQQYVKTITSVYHKYHTLVDNSFSGDSGFVAALDKACGRYINSNYVTESAHSSSKSPEILARYCDALLKRTGRGSDDEEIEDALNEAMILFKFIDDKDVFQKYYSRHLANRLVLQQSTSEEAESSMIAKLRQACGFEYINKLQRMYQDIGLSKDMNEHFKSWLGQQPTGSTSPLGIDMSMMVLSTGSWPFTQGQEFNLPSEFEPGLNIFTVYYNEQHNGRKLTWLYHRSTTEIVTNCFSKRYTFVCWTSQAAVLLLYNSSDSYTMADLMQATKLSEDIIKQLLQLFLRTKLLVMDEPVERLNPSSVLKLFKEYKNKKQRVNINVPIRFESSKVEDEKTIASVEDDRRWECQAAIVRIMKARKVLEHQFLILEVINMVKARFKPGVSLIKKCIDMLIEKEYLVRDEELKDTYKYVA